MAWRFRQQLKEYQKNPALQLENILKLKPQRLKEMGVILLILDLDGVLAAYSEETLSPNIQEWLKKTVLELGSGNVLILSNKPTSNRRQLFESLGVTFVQGFRKKPYPDGLNAILNRTQVSPHQALIVDDRLLTGILAAEIVGIKALWLTHPLINFKVKPIAELFFIVLRQIEKWVF